MSETISRPAGTHLPLALLALAVTFFLAAQIVSSGQQSRLITFQMVTGEKQIAAAKDNEGQLRKLIDQQGTVTKQIDEVQAQYQKLLDDLLKLADDDQDAKTIVEKWKIQRSKDANGAAVAAPAAGAAAPATAPAAPAEKK